MKRYIACVFALTIFFSACESFVDEPAPSSGVTSEDVFSSEEAVRTYFNGIYRVMRASWGSKADVAGVVSLNLARVVKGSDIICMSKYYTWDYRHDNRDAGLRRVDFVWEYLYEIINQTNVLIQGVEDSELSQQVKQKSIAEAKAIRGWAYFNLIREFQHTLLKDKDAPGVPVYTSPATAASKGSGRGTIQEVYDVINADLEYAVQFLGTDRLQKSNMNKNVAYGILARVYLEQQRWGEAKEAAQKAREGYTLVANEYSNGFNKIENEEWIWGFEQSADQSVKYANPGSYFDFDVTGYNNMFVSWEFVDLFADTDVRKLFDGDMDYDDYERYITMKFKQNSDFTDDIVMMRTAEMYLIEAEAKAELDESDAGDILYELQLNRDPQAMKSGNTGQDLIDEILVERRKELYGEIGIGYLDIKRRQLSLQRGTSHPAPFRFNFTPNSDLYRLKIPQKEIDANENIGPDDQNP
ncbi:RagB/SusD family nutrient uptake outer membrane protein [Puteibacter caeruleilacunae]|nr:RagB/SusD family nutrient uptake outer membrane protein [Puteibacter caeruleilacunae]